MHSFRARLLSASAFAPTSDWAAYVKAPSTGPLIMAAVQASGVDDDDMMQRAADIAAMVPYWDKTDAIVEGHDAITLGAEAFLPMFADETREDYETRLKLNKFTNVYRDIVEALASKPFEEEVTFIESDEKEKGTKTPPEIEEFAENVDGSGDNLTGFAAKTFFSGINSAIDWIFVDYPKANPAIRNRADEKAAGIRPFWSHVLARNVLEVQTRIVNGKEVLSYIRIYEPAVAGPDHVRIFQLEPEGAVNWFLYEKTDNINATTGKRIWVIVDGGTLSIDVVPLVPFYTGRRDGRTWKFLPPMRDAADLQIKLYQAESALEFICTMAGYPMLAANGLRPQMEADNKTPKKIAIGPMKVLYGLPDGNGNHGEWKFIEPDATSMKFLLERITKIIEDLRELGRQPLTATSGNLTVITTAVAAGKAKSAVSAWSLMLKNALENALVITAKWMGIDYDPQINVYNEFDSFTDGGADLTELGSARRAGDLSAETYWEELKRRKVLSPEFDPEIEKQRLLDDIPKPDMEEPDDTGYKKPAPVKPPVVVKK